MFGGLNTSTTGFTFGTPASNTSTTTGGGGGSGISGSNIFSFAANSGITPGAGTNVFGGLGVSTAVAPSTGFNFTNAATKATTGTSGSFGGFTFGSTSQTQAAPTSTAGGLTFGTAAIGGGLTLGTTSTGSSVFGSVKPATVATTSGPALTGFSGFGTTTTSLGGTGGSLLGGLLSSTSSSVSVPSVAVTTAAAASSDFTFGTTAGTSSFNFGATTTTSTTATTTALTQSFSFGSTPSLPATSVSALANSLGTGNIPGTSSASTSASTSASAAPGLSGTGVPGQKHMTFRQLEETINKWTTELEEQEKYFLDQATQVNAWDRIVIENGERIIQLNKDVEKVKLDQQKLDHELDFVHSQQKELEDIITNLEKALDSLPPISYQQHADVEREHTYVLAESLDSQLKRMGQDLKEIIERLNSTNTTPDPNDPVQQITKILNAHVVSLMWVDRNTANLQRRVEEISKQMDIEKREQERNFRLAYS